VPIAIAHGLGAAALALLAAQQSIDLLLEHALEEALNLATGVGLQRLPERTRRRA